MRYFLDFSSLWSRTSLDNRMQWLSNSHIKPSKFVEYMKLDWDKLPEKVKVALKTMDV